VIINTPQQFHEHFAALTLSTEHEQDSLYRDHLAEIIGLREKCDGLIEILKDGEGEVSEMLKALEYVEERSESLRGACEDLLEEQVRHSCCHGGHANDRRICSRTRLNWHIDLPSLHSSRRHRECSTLIKWTWCFKKTSCLWSSV
jgi:hypothetical protein